MITNQQFRRVDLLGYDHYFDEDHCQQLSCSTLGRPCEVLFIKVKSQKSNTFSNQYHVSSSIVDCSLVTIRITIDMFYRAKCSFCS